MKLPRNISGSEIIQILKRQGFEVVRQKGSHVRLARGTLKITVPMHNTLAVGTLASILNQSETSLEDLGDYF